MVSISQRTNEKSQWHATVVITCPDCGRLMRETCRLHEGGDVYVWLECTGPKCRGQLLRKVSLPSPLPRPQA